MDFLENIFRRKDKSEVYVYTPADIDKMRVNGKDLITLQNNIIRVDFLQTDHFRDPSHALFCLEVLASNGKIGAISHLQLDADVQKIGDKLLKLYSQKGVPICLAGGEAGTSDLLVTNTVNALTSRGFIVSTKPEHADILHSGNIYTNSTLYRDRVEVVNTPYSGTKSYSTLHFATTK